MESDTTTEQIIKARMERVVPSRALFVATMERVTKEKSERSFTMKAVPSPYQSLFITMRTKVIGLSLVVVAIIAVVVIKTGTAPEVPPAPSGDQALQTTPAPTPTEASSGSADDIVATLIDDATAEATIGASEEADGTALAQDAEDYNLDDNALLI